MRKYISIALIGVLAFSVSYAAVKILTGKFDISPAIWVIAALSVLSFAVA